MPRYRFTVEYDGSAYNGFQAQAGQPTVQARDEILDFFKMRLSG